MYDSKGRIVSPYDWDAYYRARGKYKFTLTQNGIEPGTDLFEQNM